MKSVFVTIIVICFVVAIILLVHKQIKEHYLQDDPMLYTLKEILKPVHPEFNNLKLYKGDKSYTINKDKIFLCLYDENGDYYPLNALVFVLLHEMAHKINHDDVGHTPKFYEVFEGLQQRAAELGVYNPSIPMIKNYCSS